MHLWEWWRCSGSYRVGQLLGLRGMFFERWVARLRLLGNILVLGDNLRRSAGPFVRVAAWATLLAMLGLSLAHPLLAQHGPTLEVRAGFDGYAAEVGWIPVQVTLANEGPDLEGLVQAISSPSGPGGVTHYQRRVSLPTHSRKRVWLYVPAYTSQRYLTVQLLVEGRVRAEARAEFNSIRERDYLVGTVSSEPSVFNLLANLPLQQNARMRVAALTPTDLPPEGRAWNALDALIVHDADWTHWNNLQFEALENWVALGGHLVVAPGPTGLSPTPEDLAPVLPLASSSGTTIVGKLDALEDLAGMELDAAGPFVVARASLEGGNLLLQEGDWLLWARRGYGSGEVDVLALDPALEPLRGWEGTEILWDRMLSPAIAARPRPLVDTLSGDPIGLYDLPNLGLPSIWQLLLFLLVYIVAIGPVNYVVLLRLNRRELAWFTIPVIAILFAGLAYLTGVRLRGGEMIAYEVNVIHAREDANVASVESFVGIFSPRRTFFQLSVPNTSLVDVARSSGAGRLWDGQTIIQGDPTLLPNVRVDVGAVRVFRASTYHPWLPMETNLTVTAVTAPSSTRAQRLEGDIRNSTGVMLEDCVLLWRGRVHSVGDLAAGQRAVIERVFVPSFLPGTLSGATRVGGPTWESIIGGNPWNAPELQGRYATLTTLFGWDESRWDPIWDDLYLIGWADIPVVQAEVIGHGVDRRQVSLVFLQLPYKTEDGGESYLSPEQIPHQVIDARGEYQLTPDGYSFQPGAFVLEYELPSASLGQYVVEMFLFVVLEGPPTSSNGASVSLWDWQSGEWIELDIYNARDGELSVPAPTRFINGQGLVHLQIETSGFLYVGGLDLALVGSE